jgi:hypothetical protein
MVQDIPNGGMVPYIWQGMHIGAANVFKYFCYITVRIVDVA